YRCWFGRSRRRTLVVDRCKDAGERGGRGSQTRPAQLEDSDTCQCQFRCEVGHPAGPVERTSRRMGKFGDGGEARPMWPFEGREAELAQLRSAFDGSEVSSALITGPAGVGKTRLAQQVLPSLRAGRTEWAAATRAAAGIPFAAVAALLPPAGVSGSL